MDTFRGFIYSDQVIGGLIGNAAGDALGLPVEFKSREDLKGIPVLEMQGFGSYLVAPGTWSTNTSMVIALMESIRECGKVNQSDILHKLSRWLYLGDYTVGSEIINSNATVTLSIDRFKKGYTPDECGDAFEFASDNGALTRILPIAFLCYNYNIQGKHRYDLVKRVTRLTHATEKCILANMIFVNYACYLLEGCYPAVALQKIQKEDYSFFSEACVDSFSRILKMNLTELPEEEIQSNSDVIESLEATIWSLVTTRNFEQAVIKAVNLGHDTDTIGALTGGLAGLYYGMQGIPKRWLDKLKKLPELETIAEGFSKAEVIIVP
ncbi:ADP-ribosylglycohydrolase family protein [Candidatus Nanosyncoccus nanoralicus]|uniref:ADP-ribosyl-[dinitrogen reductase] glycohydrolase n=1 Tax=Candidatus Nanosyncoccus nanoralicus TaxID=2171996 RepID=A0ABY0FM78_9BACT|nr:ADP-ribosylglycohydrolase family protein [Candidatus Nanosyncoccus nanoralicus]RYC73739.1 ADP-ribosyl-[dinitrogen reductase] glycohydrolase [Candidatus Nanosyncoccus nanoralicus]